MDERFAKLIGEQLLNAKGFYDYGIEKNLITAESIRLTIEARREKVKELAAAGLSQRDIAQLTGVGQSQVNRDLNQNGSKSDPERITDAVREQNNERNEALKQIEVELPKVTYGTIVIDPPWEMEKIERKVAPNQAGFDYPTMTRDELVAFPVKDLAAEDCHLFCWTTQKHLPDSLELIKEWGFKYIFLMTWHKSGGFQPFGLPQYNSEFVVYGRKGSVKFRETNAFDTCFQGERRQHSRKPDEFYNMVRRVTGDGRIDVFSRELRDGFDQYGNEVNKFAVAV